MKRVQSKVVTRWNSDIMMIKSVLNIPPEKLTAINCCHSLTSVDRLSLEHNYITDICPISNSH